VTALYLAIWVLVTLAWYVWVGVLVCRARRTASWLLVLGWPLWALGVAACAVGRFLDRRLFGLVHGRNQCEAADLYGDRCRRVAGHVNNHVGASGRWEVL
jgi:hypothetical protein